MVMIVFTLPSLRVVFKVIRDVLLPETTGRRTVLDKYRLVPSGRAGASSTCRSLSTSRSRYRASPAAPREAPCRRGRTVEVVGDESSSTTSSPKGA